MGEMRVLTVRQPWAWAIINGGKDVENRVRNVAGSYRGPVAIHAGAAWDESSYDNPKEWEIRRAITSKQNGWPADDGEVWASDMLEPEDERFVRSAIIGVVDLVGVHNATANDQTPMCWEFGDRMGAKAEGKFCSPWAQASEKHLELANPRPLANPIPFKGALGLRKIDTDTIARINAQVA